MLTSELGLQALDLAQLGFPLIFEATGYQPIVGVDLLVASLSQPGSVASPFQSEFPLLLEFSLLALHFLHDS